MARKTTVFKLVRRKKVRKARKVPRGIGNLMNQRASIIETLDLPNDLTTNFSVQSLSFCLGQFPRASQVSQYYKHYKAEYVEWVYTPYLNLFSDLTQTIPYLYTVMNRTQDLTAPSGSQPLEQWCLSQGAKPRSFTKQIVLRYKPNWCSPSMLMTRTETSLNAVAICGLKCEYGWLSAPNNNSVAGGVSTTQPLISANINPAIFPNGFTPIQNFPLATVYNGHTHYIQQGTSQTEPGKAGNLLVRVKWVFKNPSSYDVPIPPPPSEEVSESLNKQTPSSVV